MPFVHVSRPVCLQGSNHPLRGCRSSRRGAGKELVGAGNTCNLSYFLYYLAVISPNFRIFGGC